MDPIKQATRSTEISTKVAQLFKRRVELAQEHYRDRMTKAWQEAVAGLVAKPVMPWDWWTQGYNYAVDATQRSILFWDTLRQRGNNYRRARARRQAAAAALRLRDGRWTRAARAAGQLRDGAHRAAGGRRRSTRSGART